MKDEAKEDAPPNLEREKLQAIFENSEDTALPYLAHGHHRPMTPFTVDVDEGYIH